MKNASFSYSQHFPGSSAGVARLVRDQEVGGSIPPCPKNKTIGLAGRFFLFGSRGELNVKWRRANARMRRHGWRRKELTPARSKATGSRRSGGSIPPCPINKNRSANAGRFFLFGAKGDYAAKRSFLIVISLILTNCRYPLAIVNFEKLHDGLRLRRLACKFLGHGC